MTDQETNLHPKNNPSVNLKPNIVTGNIPDKAVSFKQLDENLQNKIDSQSFQIAKNTADISSLREKIDDEASTREDEDSRVRDEMTEYADHIKSDLEEKISTNKTDITKNTANIAKNTEDIANLEIRTKNLEDTKVIVNTGEFDPTSDNPAGQKSVYNMPIQFENIVDSHGNKRFVEGEGTLVKIDGVTITYNKWSLSGTHLMIVLAGNINNGTTINDLQAFASYNLPSYIANKITSIKGAHVNVGKINIYINNYETATSDVVLDKYDNTLIIVKKTSYSFTSDVAFRIQFDLLIDSD